MVADRVFIGWLLVAVGAALAVPQVFVVVPSQGAFAIGLLVAVVGGLLLCDPGRQA